MGMRKTMFEVVPLAKIAPLIANAQVLGEKQDAGMKAAPRARILSVSYDPSLSATRHLLLSSAGFQVSSVLTIEEAMRLCAAEPFDLIVLGHSIPLAQRQLLVETLRRHCDSPILALHRLGEPRLTGADHTFDSTLNPALLIETVSGILEQQIGTGPKSTPDN